MVMTGDKGCSVVEKIDFLLNAKVQSDHVVVVYERYLVAALLMTRCPPVNDEKWSKFGEIFDFLKRLITQTAISSGLHEPYMRLAAQILAQQGRTTTTLAQSLQNVLQIRRHERLTLRLADVETVLALGLWLEKGCSTDDCMNTLQELWNVYTETSLDDLKTNETFKNHALSIMKQSMESMLDQTTLVLTETDKGMIESWHKAWQQMILQVGLRLVHTSLVSLVNLLLKDWTTLKGQFSNKNVRWSWVPIILILSYKAVLDQPTRLALLQNDNTTQNLGRFLLACVSTIDDVKIVELALVSSRALAWRIIFVLSTDNNLHWLVQTTVDTKLGKAQLVCTIARMAVGEWKIQLSNATLMLIDQVASPEQTDLLQSLGQVIVQTLLYVTDLAREMDTKPFLSIPAEAILHLQHTLEEALNIAAEYLILYRPGNPNVAVVALVLHVFSTLLQDFDVFETKLSNVKGDYPLLNVVQASLAIEKVDCCVVGQCTIVAHSLKQALCENEKSRLAALNERNILDDRLLRLLVLFWSLEPPLEAIPIVCGLIETLKTINDKTFLDFQIELKSAIVDWIDSTVDNYTDSRTDALSSAVACYVTLQGDEAPDNQQSTVIKRALGLVDTYV